MLEPRIIVVWLVLGAAMLPAQDTFGWRPETPLVEVLRDLGQPFTPHHLDQETVRRHASIGEAIVRNGSATGPDGENAAVQSRYFRCTHCHLLDREDPDLRVSDADARLAYLRKRNLALLPGTTLYGLVNKSSWYNGENVKKYGEKLIAPARHNLREAIQLCSKECSSGRRLEDWELRGVLAFLWTRQYRLSDLTLSAEDKARLDRLRRAGIKDAAGAAWLSGFFRSGSPATFAKANRSLPKSGDRAKGRYLYEKSCTVCHEPSALGSKVTFGPEDEVLLPPVGLREEFASGTSHSAIREGVSKSGAYMPAFTMERLSDQHIADLRAYVEGAQLTADGAAASATSLSQQEDPDIVPKVRSILLASCYPCHGKDGAAKGKLQDILDRDLLLKKKLLNLKSPEDSVLWERVSLGEMPPASAVRKGVAKGISEADKKVLLNWIKAGAPSLASEAKPEEQDGAETPRTPVRRRDLWITTRDWLRRVPVAERRYFRFFTLEHVHNQVGITNRDQRLHRAALAKAVNSVTWAGSLARLIAVDDEQTILALDQREVDWHESPEWERILKRFPYGVSYVEAPQDDEWNEAAREICEWTGTSVPIIHGDWFIAVALQPPLYHELLSIPFTADALERRLGVDAQSNFRHNRLKRSALIEDSGISDHNRLVEYHPSKFGGYWKSYDFRSSSGEQSLVQRPLGPAFEDHPFPRQVFEADGGEIIFTLPNGMQAYMLVDGKNRRIDKGPTDVVHDDLKTSGSPEIVNGLSCIACHGQGMKMGFADQVRPKVQFGGALQKKIERLYPLAPEFDRLLQRDAARFIRTCREVMKPWLEPDEMGKADGAIPEVVGPVARRYLLENLSAEVIALELGVPLQDLLSASTYNPVIRKLGLADLKAGGTLKREAWMDQPDGQSLFHRLIRALRLGTPMHVR